MELIQTKNELLNEKNGLRTMHFNIVKDEKVITEIIVNIFGYYGNGNIDYFSHEEMDVSEGLNMLCDKLFNNDLVSTLSLIANTDRKKEEAINCGFINTINNEFVRPHEEATRVYGMKIERLCNLYPDKMGMYTKMMEDFSNYLHFLKDLKTKKK